MTTDTLAVDPPREPAHDVDGYENRMTINAKDSPKILRPLNRRLLKIIASFSLLILCVYTGMLGLVYVWGLSTASHDVLRQESEHFVRAYEQDPNTPLPRAHYLRGYIGVDQLPADILAIFPYEKWEQWPSNPSRVLYANETTADGGMRFFHLLVSDLPGSEEPFILYYEADSPKAVMDRIWSRFRFTAAVGVLIIALALLLFVTEIRKAVSPVISLSRWIDSLQEQELPPDLPKDLTADEIGQLADSLEAALRRLYEHNKKEKQFLRNASHELRTPIAIIGNTMDVLEHRVSQENHKLSQPLQRIRRAANTMRSVTETILQLASENRLHEEQKTLALNLAVEAAISSNLQATGVVRHSAQDTIVVTGESFDLNAHPALLHIVIDNLVRNALQHCHGGKIMLHMSKPCLEIVNSAQGYTQNARHHETGQTPSTGVETNERIVSGSFGFGLALVQQVCERQGWRFTFMLKGNEARALVDFEDSRDT